MTGLLAELSCLTSKKESNYRFGPVLLHAIQRGIPGVNHRLVDLIVIVLLISFYYDWFI
jgi:hypothetical protein